MELDQYIELKGRVECRMKATVLTSTGNENILESATESEKDDLEYRKTQLQRLQHEVVDIEDMDTGINIMDLGLNEFRLDLLAYIKDNPDVEHAPCGMDAVVMHSAMAKPGVIYILRNRSNEVNIDRKNLLHQAIESIIDVKEGSDIDSLFSVGETSALRGEIQGLDDFELITFLVIK